MQKTTYKKKKTYQTPKKSRVPSKKGGIAILGVLYVIQEIANQYINFYFIVSPLLGSLEFSGLTNYDLSTITQALALVSIPAFGILLVFFVVGFKKRRKNKYEYQSS